MTTPPSFPWRPLNPPNSQYSPTRPRCLVVFGLVCLLVCPAASSLAALRPPGEVNIHAPLVSPDEASRVLSTRQVPEQAEGVTPKDWSAGFAGTSMLQAQARGLRNDPDLIYQYVHDQIQYVLIYGSVKGAAGTLVEGRGNDFDQAALMIALLRQAGFTANFIYGQIRLVPAQLGNWLGVTNNPSVVARLLGTAGIPGTLYTYGDGSLAYVDIDHVWVQVTIGGTNFVFDPSFKTNVVTAGINVPAAMGYNQSTFLTTALTGATNNATYLQNVNAAGMRTALANYSLNLINYIKTNSPAASLDQVIGGRTIVPVAGRLRQTALPYQQSVKYVWTNVPAYYRTTLQIQHVGINATLFSDDIYGQRLTLFYETTNRPVLRLDGTILATGTNVPSYSYQPLTLIVDHPYAAGGGTYGDDGAVQYLIALNGYGYYIVNSWGGTGPGVVAQFRKQVQQDTFAGNSSTSEPVLGGSLAIIGSQYAAERGRAEDLSDRLFNTCTINHHILGVCAQNDAPNMDIPLGTDSSVSLDGNAANELATSVSEIGHSSAFEWGAIHQNQPSEPAICTIKLLDIANALTNRFYDATSTNYYTTVKPQLVNYSSAKFAYIESYIDAGYRLILHQNGNIGEGLWSGIGFLAITPDGVEHGRDDLRRLARRLRHLSPVGHGDSHHRE